jgi:hypothetical protein
MSKMMAVFDPMDFPLVRVRGRDDWPDVAVEIWLEWTRPAGTVGLDFVLGRF